MEARAAGCGTCSCPRTHEYGAGLTNLQYAPLAEITGRNPWIAPEALNCSAPDTGNMELLSLFGTEEQKQEWLEPLLEGEIRSAFSMTEPEVASSDATNIATRIERDGDHYVINGRKWWTSGAMSPRCELLIVMGVTDPDAERHRRQSMILVPKDTPGVTMLQRSTSVFGYDDGPHGGHAEIIYDNVRVPAANLLGEEGDGFRIAQERLGPGRIHHAMRAIGMAERALEMMCERTRSAVDVRAADHRAWRRPALDLGVAVRIEQVRLLVLKTAWLMDTVGNRGARIEVSAIKVAAPEVATWVIDRAIQAHGGAGVSQDILLRRAVRGRADPADRRRSRRGPPHGDRPARDTALPIRAGRQLTGRRPELGRRVSVQQLPSGLDQRRDEPLGVVEPGADHRAAGGSRRDPLADDGELEVGERVVPAHVRGVDAGPAGVALDDLRAGREPGQRVTGATIRAR